MVTKNILFRGGADPKAFSFELDDTKPIHQNILTYLQSGHLYEPDVSLFMARVLRPGDTVIDVGANIGFFSMLAGALVGPTGRVLAFEPGANNLPELKHNRTLNGFDHVEIHESPVSACVETVEFYVNSDNGGGNALWNPGQFPGNEKSQADVRAVRLQTTTLDDQLARLSSSQFVKLIKIDTEGAEYKVLSGARRLLQERMVPFIVCELHDFGLEKLGDSSKTLRSFMKGLGYDTFVLPYDGDLPRLVPLETRILYKVFRNLVFTRAESLGAYWKSVEIG
jgi:FkbM family methyltransferase